MILKKRKSIKPASLLQVVSSKVNWFVGCRLQKIYQIPIQSQEAYTAMLAYNEAVDNLRKVVKEDYQQYKLEYTKKAREFK